MDPVIQAKQYLQQHSDRTDTCLYDHLTELISQLLEKRPDNPVDIFESVSTQIKNQRLSLASPHAPLGFTNVPDHTLAHQQAQLLLSALQAGTKKSEESGDDGTSGQVPDIIDLSNLFESAGVSLGKEETFLLALSVHQLVHERSLQSARFWGKILGTTACYYIVEGEGGSNSEEETPLNTRADEVSSGATLEEVLELQGFRELKPATEHPLPKEESIGCNKYAYYVCTSLGTKWIRLPEVQPQHITAAKTIRKLMTGDLNKRIVSYPAFKGTEAQYLRAQIARISAATVVCPQGYYTFDTENADEEHPELNTAIIVNSEYDVLPNEAMLSLENWVHQIPYILAQGRTVWMHPESDNEEEANEENEDEQEEEDDSGQATQEEGEKEPETGPPLLTSVSEDQEVQPNVPAWSVRACSRMMPKKFSPVHLRSNRWLGAHAVYYQNKFACLYVGNGLKELGSTSSASFELPKLAEFMVEYQVPVIGDGTAGLNEQTDPTVAQEKEYEELLQQKKDDAMPDEEEDGDQGQEEP